MSRPRIKLHVWTARWIVLTGLALSIVFGGCKSPSDPGASHEFPYQFQLANTLNGPVVPADLNGDGTDELLMRSSTSKHVSSRYELNALKLQTLEEKIIRQVNFASPIQRPHVLDVTGDGRREVFVPFVRRDSLFLSVLGPTGEKKFQFFVTTGEPRREPEGTLPWDPSVRELYWTDTNGDGSRELLSAVQTRYARLPRGVWIHDLPSGTLLGKSIVGAPLDQRILHDVDEDPHQELLVAAGASNNGAKAGGMSDQYAYHYAFDLGRPPEVQWKRRLGSPHINAKLYSGNFNRSGGTEYVAFASASRGGSMTARVQIIDPETGRPRLARSFPFVIRKPSVAEVDGDGADELLLLDAAGTLHLLGRGLAEEERVQLGPGTGDIGTVRDVTGDGTSEILVHRGGRTLLLGPALKVRAVLRARDFEWKVVERGGGELPYFYLEESNRAKLYRLVPNRYWWLYRYGPWALGLLGTGLLIGGGYGAWRGYQRYHRSQALRKQLQTVVGDRLLLAREDGSIRPLNAAARRWIHQTRGDTEGKEPIPELSAWIESLDPTTEESVQMDVAVGQDSQDPVRVDAHPLREAGSGPSRWLLRADSPKKTESTNGLDGPRTWRLMARRVAHDLKNPLTSILLAVRRLRNEQEDRAPELAEDLAPYTDRIENRIRRLRRMTLNFMKLVGGEGPSLAKGNLAEFTRSVAKRLRTDLASDITLEVQVDGDLPTTYFDHDQMTSVLENLVGNATDALHEGGEITLSLWLERGFQPDSDTNPGDYAVIEVADTGEGMNSEATKQAFEPGFSTSEEGAGLGLPIVKKIVEDHGGTVELESEDGLGTAVTLYLPVSGRPQGSSGSGTDAE